MGEFTNGESPDQFASKSRTYVEENPGKVQTDVPDVFADGKRFGFPVFNVSKKEFDSNMSVDRKRLRFTNGSNVQKYMLATRYNRPFFISYSEESGNRYLRKVK
jgi:hypothetical protein